MAEKSSAPSTGRRLARAELLLLGGFVVAAAVTILLVIPPSVDPAAAQWKQTSSGPLSAADRDLLIKVRQAGLWEMPAGEYAATRAESPTVKQVGKQIMNEHAKLDVLTRQTATKLGVALPNEPNGDQQSWMAQLAAESGPAFDQDYANLLRAAHGKVFSTLAAVRAGTRNSEIRKFAGEGINFVMRHMTYLESTGLVEHTDLPEAPTPSPIPPTAFVEQKRLP
jgi:predicted outer membrane protein